MDGTPWRLSARWVRALSSQTLMQEGLLNTGVPESSMFSAQATSLSQNSTKS